MNNDLRPYMPTHPGEVLKDELQARGISQKKFSSLIGVSYTLLNEILNGKRPISADMSLLLEAALGLMLLSGIICKVAIILKRQA